MKKEILISYFGNTVKTALALHVRQPTVSSWPDDLPFSVLGRIAFYQPKAWRDLMRKDKPAESPIEDSQ